MAFNHFFKFLLEHEPRHYPISSSVIGWAFLGFVLSLITLPINIFLGGAFAIIAILLILLPQVVGHFRARKAIQRVPYELEETWQLVRWMAIRRELNHRTHPALRELLEEIASIRKTTLEALSSNTWRTRAKTPEGAKAVNDIESVLREALYDSIYIGRHLFRGKGQREATFLKRCADPEFGRHSLESIRQIRDELRLLCDSTLAAGEMSDLRMNLLKDRMQALVDAEREIEEESNFDPAD